MVTKYSQHTTNDLACKEKWGLIIGDFKKVVDYMLGTSHNQEYWTLSPQEKVVFHLP
jgi:hypothetical protein